METNKTAWIERDGMAQLVEVTETSIGQFGDREEAQGAAIFHSTEFDRVVVRRDAVYGFRAVGQTYGRIIRSVA